MLLKVGRHLRPKPHYKIIIGREEGENNYLSGYRHQFTSIKTVSHEGPFTLVDGPATDDDLLEAAAIVARYSQGRDADQVTVEISEPDGSSSRRSVTPLSSSEVVQHWYV